MPSDPETSHADPDFNWEDAVRSRLRNWADQGEDEDLAFACQRALVLADPAKEVLRSALPADLKLRLANDGREFTLYTFRDPGTVEVLADSVARSVKVGPGGLPLDKLRLLDTLMDSSITMLRSIAQRIRIRPLDLQTGFTGQRQALLAEISEAIAAQLTARRSSIIADVSQRDTLSADKVQTAAVALEKHFSMLRRSESMTATFLLCASGSILVIATILSGIPIVLPSILPDTGQTWYTAVHIMTIMLPIYGLAGYLVRESSKHRNVSIWATRLTAQLQSIAPFVASFKGTYSVEQIDDTRDLWMTFGRDNVFAPDTGQESSIVNTDINDVVKHIADIASSAAKGASN